jgi:hypothetical protein
MTLFASDGEAREEISIVLAALWRDSMILTAMVGGSRLLMRLTPFRQPGR